MTDIQELYMRDPLSYSKEGGEVAAIVEDLRKRRHLFRSAGQPSKSPNRTTSKVTPQIEIEL